MSDLLQKTMYRVEKFKPTQCPHCGHRFLKQNQDWIMFMGTIEDGKKVPDPHWPRIICAACDGPPIKQIKVKEYQLSSEEEVDRLVSECGYINKTEVVAVGNMTHDHCVDYEKSGQPKLQVIRCDDE